MNYTQFLNPGFQGGLLIGLHVLATGGQVLVGLIWIGNDPPFTYPHVLKSIKTKSSCY